MQTSLIGENKQVTSEDVRNALHSKYRADQYLKIEEFDEFRTGRRIDFMAVSLVRSRPGVHGIEIKVSRTDWLKEMRTAMKADAFYFCDYYYLASPPGIWQNGEVPSGWGIYEFSGDKVKLIRDPTLLPSKYDFMFLKTLIGRILRPESSAISKARKEGYNDGYNAGKRSIETAYETKSLQRQLDNYKTVFGEFKANSGIDITSIWELGNIGKIVKMIQNNTKAEEEYNSMKERIQYMIAKLNKLNDDLEKAVSE